MSQEVAKLYEAEKMQSIDSISFLRLLQHIRDNQLFYRTYFKLGYDGSHETELYDMRKTACDLGIHHIAYHIAFFKSGFNAIVKMWLAGGCKESPEEINGIIRSEYQGRPCFTPSGQEKTDRQTLNNTI